MNKPTSNISRILAKAVEINPDSPSAATDYFRSRGLTITTSRALLFHPELECYEDYKCVGKFPAIIGVISTSDGPTGIQRIYLDPSGRKASVSANKKMLGKLDGGGIILDTILDATEINIAEGVETSLAVRESTNLPTVAGVSAVGLERMILPENVRVVHVWADKDRSDAGQKAAKNLANRLLDEGRQVFLHIPPLEIAEDQKGIDWLDVLNLGRRDLISNAFHSEAYKKTSQILAWPLDKYLEEGRFPPPSPIVEGLINKQELHIMSATAKTGKSMLAANLALSIATGASLFGKFHTKPTPVLLIQTEVSDSQFSDRIRNMVRALQLADIPKHLYISSQRFKLDQSDGLSDLRLKIEENNIGFVVLDPFYTLHNKDEDKSKDIAPLLADLREMIIETGASCLLIHHQGKYGEKSDRRQTGHTHRGSSSLADVPDGSWCLSRKDEGQQIASLSFELRNSRAPDALRLQFNKELWWQLVGEEKKLSESEALSEVSALLAENEEISLQEYTERIDAQLGKKTRTAHRLISSAVKAKKVLVRVEDKKKFYSLPNLTPEGPWDLSEESEHIGFNARPNGKTL